MNPLRSRRAGAVTLAALLVILAVAGSAIAASAGDGGARMTICHKPDAEARTLEVSRSAWPAHRDHGDHEGACDDDAVASDAKTKTGGASDAATAELSVTVRSDGGPDGSAEFRVIVRNQGDAAEGVRVSGILHGDGEWRVRSAGCTLEESRFRCQIGPLDEGGDVTIRLAFEAGPRVCEHAGLHATVEASNDRADEDNEAEARQSVGACSAVPDAPA